jgi:hypothetical protein
MTGQASPTDVDTHVDHSDGNGAGQGDFVLETSLLGKLAIPHAAGREEELAELAARAAQYAVRARGGGTVRAYRSVWAGFTSWCHDFGHAPLAGDPDTIDGSAWVRSTSRR